ncbi:MAG: glycosyltransferase [Planctomycetes bacterium]|nr:glycosyltransferase [Planctomycetota bacterium]
MTQSEPDREWTRPVVTNSPLRRVSCDSEASLVPLQEGHEPGHEVLVDSLQRARFLPTLAASLGATRVHLVDYPGSVLSLPTAQGLALVASRSLQRKLARLPGVERLVESLWGHRLNPPWPSPEATLALADAVAADPAPLRPGQGIAHYIGSLSAGGAERQLSYLCEQQGGGARVYVRAPLEGEHAHHAPRLARAGVSSTYLPPLLRSRPLDLPGLSPEHRALLERHCEREGIAPLIAALRRDPPAVLHCWLDGCNIAGAIAGLLSGVPRIVLGVRSLSPKDSPNLNQPWYRQSYASLARSERIRICANSAAGAKDYAAWSDLGSETVSVVPNGLDVSEWSTPSPQAREETRRTLGIADDEVLVVGAFRQIEVKRPGDFLRALAQAHQSFPRLRAIHLGSGPLEASFRAEARSLGLDGVLQHLGRRQDVVSLMGAADLVMLCSRQEGCPNTLLEGQALGLPAITTAAGGAPEVVREGVTGFVVPVGDVEALAERILRLAESPELRATFGAAARSWIHERFSLEAMADAYTELYESESEG